MPKKERSKLPRRQFISGAGVALAIPFLSLDAVAQQSGKASQTATATIPVFVSGAVTRKTSQSSIRRVRTQVALACGEVSRAMAAVNPNPEVLGRLIAEDAVFLDFDGKVRNKKEMLAYNSEMSSKQLYQNLKVDSQNVTVVAEDTAILMVQMSARGQDSENRDISGQFRIAHIFADRGGTWQMIAVKMFKVA